MTKTNRTTSVAAFMVAAVALAGGASAAEKPGFVSGGKFAVCTDASFPPMEYFEKTGDKQPVGFDVDFMHRMAEGWKVTLDILPMDFSGLLPSLEAKRCDAVISGIFVTSERKQKFDAVSYLDTVSVLVSKSGTAKVGSLEDLAGKTVAVQTGTDFVKLFDEINAGFKAKGLAPINVQLYPKASDGIQQVLIGRAYAATTQDTELAFRELQNPGALTSIYEFPDARTFGIFVRKSDGDAAAVLAMTTELKTAGALDAIAKRWRLDPKKVVVRP